MKIPQASEFDGPQKSSDHFVNWRGIKGGQKHIAHVAGPVQWVYMHCSDLGSKPCLYLLSKKCLPCRFCGASKPPQMVGYLPVYRVPDQKAYCVILYAEMKVTTESLKLHQKITIGREHEKGSALWVQPCMAQDPAFVPAFPFRADAQDVGDSLLKLWGVPELALWLSGHNVREEAPSAPAVVPMQLDGEERNARYSREAAKGNRRGPRLAADATDAILARMQDAGEIPEPSTNGKH